MLQDTNELVGLINHYDFTATIDPILLGGDSKWEIVLRGQKKRITIKCDDVVTGLHEALTTVILFKFERDMRWPAKDLIYKHVIVEDV